MEADPFVTQITNSFAAEIHDILPHESFFLVNKLSTEETSAFATIEKFLRILNHLPPIPFDFEVRRNFMLRRIPFSLDKPSPFSYALVRVTKDLFPTAEKVLSKAEAKLKEWETEPKLKRIEELEKRLYELASLRSDLTSDLGNARSSTELFRIIFFGLVPLIGGLIMSIFLTGFTSIVLRSTQIAGILLALTAGALLIVSTMYNRILSREKRSKAIKRNIAALNEKIQLTRLELDAQRNLLETIDYNRPANELTTDKRDANEDT